MNVAPLFKHSSSADHQDQWIAEFSRSKDLDATAISPIPPVFILINSSLEVVWMSSESCAPSFVFLFSILKKDLWTFKQGFLSLKFEEKNCNMIFRKWGEGGSKAGWNFSENSTLLVWPPVP